MYFDSILILDRIPGAYFYSDRRPFCRVGYSYGKVKLLRLCSEVHLNYPYRYYVLQNKI